MLVTLRLLKNFKEFVAYRGVEFNGTLRRFYVVSYKNFLVESNYEVATGAMKEIVVENSKDRVRIAYGSEKQVEVYSDKEVDRILF
jgi:integrase/recombinase XerD